MHGAERPDPHRSPPRRICGGGAFRVVEAHQETYTYDGRVMADGQRASQFRQPEHPDGYRAHEKQRIGGVGERHQSLAFDAGSQPGPGQIAGHLGAQRIARGQPDGHREGPGAGDSKQRSHQRFQEDADKMDDAQAHHNLGQYEKWKQRRQDDVKPKPDPLTDDLNASSGNSITAVVSTTPMSAVT